MDKTRISQSIVTARNLGIEKHDREQVHVQIEKFLLQTMTIHGLSRSDIVNIALEKYLTEENYLSEDTINTLDNITELEKNIFKKGLF